MLLVCSKPHSWHSAPSTRHSALQSQALQNSELALWRQFSHCMCPPPGTPGPAGPWRCGERSKGKGGSTSEERAFRKNGESSQRASEWLGYGGQNVWIPRDDLLPAWPGGAGTQRLWGTADIHKPGCNMKGFRNTWIVFRSWSWWSLWVRIFYDSMMFVVVWIFLSKIWQIFLGGGREGESLFLNGMNGYLKAVTLSEVGSLSFSIL